MKKLLLLFIAIAFVSCNEVSDSMSTTATTDYIMVVYDESGLAVDTIEVDSWDHIEPGITYITEDGVKHFTNRPVDIKSLNQNKDE